MLLSDHGHPLVFQGEPWKNPILTVENYLKWYTLYLVMPDGEIRSLVYTGLILPEKFKDQVLFVDHVPNPRAVAYTASQRHFYVDPVSFEAIIGRWQLEVKYEDYGEITVL